MTEFTEIHPTLDNYWRAVILFGRNVASYKFALGKSLLEVAAKGTSVVSLSELAVPFSRHLCEHLKGCDKQVTSKSSRFLDECRKFNRGELTETGLVEATAKLGFVNVIDAFHIVDRSEIAVRFFADERAGVGAIRLTDDLFRMAQSYQRRNLPAEIEARWRLVETAWELSLPTSALVVDYDEVTGGLVAQSRLERRKAVAPCRDALNGYQKGKCFYCFADVSVEVGADDLGDVDHVFPHTLRFRIPGSPLAGRINGIWNLVLACQSCNRGAAGKFDSLPALRYVERLHARNEFLIHSHHPLRETLILQTGDDEPARRAFLNEAYRCARTEGGLVGDNWRPVIEHERAFGPDS
ncbi:MAG: HNH endonuclease [Planctomycetaceae bacterium]|nr:HNH endonuclease [Planctomycetaceae bacterium]